jgi:hypothetical protein
MKGGLGAEWDLRTAWPVACARKRSEA